MKVVIDAFGSDHPELIIKGVAKTIRETQEVELVLVGQSDYAEEILKDEVFDRSRLEYLDATEVITNNDSPVLAIRQKRDSSLVKAFKRLKEDDEAVAYVSAGSTGAVIVGASLILGRMNGVERPTLTTNLPTLNGKEVCLVDCGANVDCRASHLLQFAKLGSAYLQSVRGISEPKIGLLSVGTEDEKGNSVTKETFGLLKQSGLNFVGNIEGKTLLSGEVDLIVCDGFVGNVAIKTVESTTLCILKIFMEMLKKHSTPTTDFSFVKSALGEFMSTYDFNKMGSGVLLGVNKPVIKMHGSSNEDSVLSAVTQAIAIKNGGYVEKIRSLLE